MRHLSFSHFNVLFLSLSLMIINTICIFFYVCLKQMGGINKNPLASLAALGLAGMAPSNTGGLNPTGRFLICVFFYHWLGVYFFFIFFL